MRPVTKIGDLGAKCRSRISSGLVMDVTRAGKSSHSPKFAPGSKIRTIAGVGVPTRNGSKTNVER